MSRRALARHLGIGSLTAILTLTSVSGLFAHPEGPAHHNPLPTHATEVMRAFADDSHAAQELEAVVGGTPCNGGSAAGYPCNNVDLLAFLPLADIGGGRSNSAANDIWGWTDPVGGKEYAIIGRVFGTSFVDISDPLNPVYLGDLPTHGAFGSDWRDIKVYSNHAFIVSEANQHGMQVFDLTQLRNVTNPPVTFGETAHYKKNSSAHNIVVNEDSGYAYLVGTSGKNSCSGGLHMVDIQNPTRPQFAGCFSSDGYTHDAQCVNYSGPDADYQGQEICFNSNEDTLTIVDVTNKSNPVQISRTGYSGSEYTHQGWLTNDQSYFLLDDELDEYYLGGLTRTRLWDLTDLDNPSVITTYNGETTAIDHNQYVKGDFSYQANYRAGLRIQHVPDLAAGQPSSVVEAGYFDIWPTDNSPQFNGAWSNYPYFDSGVVIVSGIEQGLFVLRPNLGTGGNPLTVTITNPVNGDTVVGDSVTITADTSGDNTINQVEFFVGSALIDTDIDGSNGWSASWDLTSVGDADYDIMATATDSTNQTASDTITVTVDNEPDPTIHVGDLDGAGTPGGRGSKWDATVTITVHDASEIAVANATVAGTWTSGANGSDLCVTDGAGQCSITKTNINRNSTSTTFTVDNVTSASSVYDAEGNHDTDPDPDSNGTVIVISKP